jgi:hypothetical protein
VRNILVDERATPERAGRFCLAMERAFPEPLVDPPSTCVTFLQVFWLLSASKP